MTSTEEEDPRSSSLVAATTTTTPRGGGGGTMINSRTAPNDHGAAAAAAARAAASSTTTLLPDEDRRFVERMRRRTLVRLDNPDAIAEARRAGTYVADRILQRTAASSSMSISNSSGVAAANSTAPPPPPTLSLPSTSASTRQLLARTAGGGISPSTSFRASSASAAVEAPLFHSAIASSSALPSSSSSSMMALRGRAGSSSSLLSPGGGGNSILDSRRGSYLLLPNNNNNDSFPRLSENHLLATIPSFDLSVESSQNHNHQQPPSNDDDDDNDSDDDGPPADVQPIQSTAATSSQQQHNSNFTSRESSERAVRRGSRRGTRESNERERDLVDPATFVAPYPHARHGGGGGGDDEWSAYSDFDVTTLTDAFTDFTTKESVRQRRQTQQQQQQQQEKQKSVAKKKTKRGKWLGPSKPKWLSLGSVGGGGSSSSHRGRKRSTSYSKSDLGGDPHDYESYYPAEDDVEDDAWMCGVCGEVFPSLEVAERHEDQHLRKVIQKLGWHAADAPGPFGMVPPPPPPSTTAAVAAAAAASSPTEEAAQAAALHANDTLRQLGFFGPDPPSGVPATGGGGGGGAGGGRRLRFDSSDSIPNLRGGVVDVNSGTQSAPFNRLSAGDRFYSMRQSGPDDEEADEAFGNTKIAARTQPVGGANAAAQPKGPSRPPAIGAQNRLVSAGQYRSDLAEDTLIPTKRRPRTASGSEVRFEDANIGSMGDPSLKSNAPVPFPNSTRLAGDEAMPSLLMSDTMQNYVVLADEALLNVCWRATPLILAPNEVQAERHLAYLGKDKAYYDDIVSRAQARRTNPSNRYRSDATDTLRGKVQNKLLDAYQLMKEGDGNLGRKDVYNRKQQEDGAGADSMIHHSSSTMYVNVLVRNSVQVVKHELERLAREKWEHPDEGKEKYTRFELFRVYAHVNFVKLAGLALASDFTPRRIAIQLSNDIYRLLTPRLKRRGVTIGTEIEYRVGGYFVLAVNINTIDWAKLIKTNNRDLKARKARWRKESSSKQHDDGADEHGMSRLTMLMSLLATLRRRFVSLSKYDLIDHILAWMYNLHWLVYLPLCIIAYKTPGIGSTIRKFIISSAIDEICYYVHERGMEMEIRVLKAEYQASFMLSALREIRADGRELKKKRQETEAQEVGSILGPLLGPKIKDDDGPAIAPPGFELPANLDFVGLEVDLPVGFRRLRWAYLSRKSTFITDALWKTESKYENITISDWTKHSDFIGDPNLPPTVSAEDFIGAEFEASYLMPKSAFVSANMSYATSQLIAYNDYCFCVKTRSRNPDAPFGSTFVAWTQVLVINAGHNCCKLICSVEAEFPNGPPMVARQIQSGMRAGTGESFVLMGETISKYANSFP